jgi:multidrug efflux pump subunit AcrB
MNRFNLSALAVKERAITLFLLLAITGAGLLAFSKLGRAEDPTFVVKIMTVTAIWPGATAEEMQNQVADRLEKRLQELEHYDRSETTSRPGLMTMKVFLKDNTPPKEVPDEFYQARKKLGDEARFLPRGVLGPVFNDEYTDVFFSLYALKAPDLPHRDLVQDAERLRQRLTRVPGVQKVKIMGEQDQKIFVEISYQRLATLGLSAQSLFSAIARHNDVTPSGFVEAAGPRVYLRVDGAITDVESVKSIPLPVPGKTLTVGDVAEVRKGYEDPASFVIREGGQPALILGVVMHKRYNGLTLGEDLSAEVRRLQAELPVGITLAHVSDQASVIKAAISEFMVKFFTALGVVILVSLLTLGFRVGIVVAAAVPLTLGAVFLIMLVTGRDFDRITLGALILSLGLLVDDAIIAIETMVVKMEEGWDRVKAAGYAWTSTAAPMLTGTLVTIVGFLPVGFARSTAGEYAGNIFWIVAFSLLVSWFVAVIFTPYMGVKLLPDIPPKGDHHSIYATKNYERFRRLIRKCVDHKWLTMGITVGLFAASVLGMKFVKKQFFPNSDRVELTLEINLPAGSAFTTTEQTVHRIEQAMLALPEAKHVTSYVGQGAPRFFFSLNSELPNPAFAQVVIQTENPHERDLLKNKIRGLVADGYFPEARVRVTQFLFGPPVPYPVLFRVTGDNLNEIRRIATDVRQVMEKNPHLRDVHLDWSEKTPVLHLAFDEERLHLLGLNPQDAALQLQSILQGITVSQVRSGDRTVDVQVRSPKLERDGLDAIGDAILRNDQGRSIPLRQIARIETRMEDAVLKRFDRELYIAVQGDIIDGVQPPDVTAELLPQLAASGPAYPSVTGSIRAGPLKKATKPTRHWRCCSPL